MRGDQIVEGGTYAWRQGRHGAGRRCVVVDRTPVFSNRYVHLWPRDDNLARRHPFKTGRFLVAVEFEFTVDDDGVAYWSGGGLIQIPTGPPGVYSEWQPWAARSAEIIRPWDEELARQADEDELARQRAEIRRREDEEHRARQQEMNLLRSEEAAWRTAWREERDRRLGIETHQRIVGRMAEIVDEQIPAGWPSRTKAAVEQIVEEFEVDLREPIPDPLDVVQGRA